MSGSSKLKFIPSVKRVETRVQNKCVTSRTLSPLRTKSPAMSAKVAFFLKSWQCVQNIQSQARKYFI